MTLAKNLLIAVLGIALAFGLYTIVKNRGLFSLQKPPEEVVATTTPPIEAPRLITYVSDTFGIAFSYPEGYVMKEIDADTKERRHTTITLVRQEEQLPPENGEGPPGIALDFYQNDLDRMTLNGWLNTAPSNFKLGSGAYASTTVAGIEAVQYRWSGLYEGETTAFLHKDNVVAVSVTFFSPEDELVAVYRALVRTLELR